MLNETPDVESSTLDYQKRFSGTVGKWFLEVQSESLKKILQQVEGENVIDFGGGHAQNIKVIRELGKHLTILGSDKSCKQLIVKEIENAEIKFVEGSLLDSVEKNRQYDIALSFRMLPHLNDWKSHVKELCRTSSKAVVIEFPSKLSINIISNYLFSLKKGFEKNTRPFKLFLYKEIVKEFKVHGFEPMDRVGQYIMPMVIYRMMGSVFFAKVIESFFTKIGIKNIFGSPLICGFKRIDV